MADFGFSLPETITSIKLPISHGWHAPEVTNSYPDFTFTGAVKADIFSLGLILLWLTKAVTRNAFLGKASSQTQTHAAGTDKSHNDEDLDWFGVAQQVQIHGIDAPPLRAILQSLKLLTSEDYVQKIEKFLALALRHDYNVRIGSCSDLLQVLGRSK